MANGVPREYHGECLCHKVLILTQLNPDILVRDVDRMVFRAYTVVFWANTVACWANTVLFWQIQWYLGNYSGNLGKYYDLYLAIYKLVQPFTSISINFQPFTGTFQDLYKLVVTYLKLLFQWEGWVNKHNNHNFFRSDSCHER